MSAQELSKLHKQFGHCSLIALKRLLTSANYSYSLNELQKCHEKCEFCHSRVRPARQPIVSMPFCTSFNEVLALDLSCLKGGDWFLPIICVFSRYCVAVTVNDKSARSIFSALYKNWICSFGPPKEAILTDNGREFDNDMLQEFCEKLYLNTITR